MSLAVSSRRRKHVVGEVLSEWNHKCAYGCGRQANTIDHVVPISKGGMKSNRLNLVAACYKCNIIKSDKEVEVFLKNKPGRLIAFLRKWKIITECRQRWEDIRNRDYHINKGYYDYGCDSKAKDANG